MFLHEPKFSVQSLQTGERSGLQSPASRSNPHVRRNPPKVDPKTFRVSKIVLFTLKVISSSGRTWAVVFRQTWQRNRRDSWYKGLQHCLVSGFFHAKRSSKSQTSYDWLSADCQNFHTRTSAYLRRSLLVVWQDRHSCLQSNPLFKN